MNPCIHKSYDPTTCRLCIRNEQRTVGIESPFGSLANLQRTCVICGDRFLPSHGKQIRCPQCQASNYGKTKLTEIK